MIPFMISTTAKQADWAQSKCDVCGETIYDHQENFDFVRQKGGWAVCPVCALLAKLEVPSVEIEGQLWHGHIRALTNIHPSWNPFINIVQKKP